MFAWNIMKLDKNRLDKYPDLKWTPLHWFAFRRRDIMAHVLVQAGADVTARNNKGSTPLHLAVALQRKSTSTILVKAGSDIDATDNRGNTPLDYATEELRDCLEDLASQITEIKAAFPSIAGTKEFRALLMRGTYSSYNNRVYFAGACNVGKTTLASNFIGERILMEWVSTDGLIIYFGRNGIDLEKRKMVPLAKGSKDSSILTSVLRGNPCMDQLDATTKEKKVRKHPTKPKITHTKSVLSNTSEMENADFAFKQRSSLKTTGLSDSIDEKRGDVRAHNVKTRDHHRVRVSKQENTDIRQTIMEEIRKGEYKMAIAPSDLVDFGGQKVYDLTHQLFIQQKGAFVLLIDGRKDFDDILPEYPNGDIRTRGIVLHWVNSILTYSSADDDDIYPLIVFAATHQDELTVVQKKKKANAFTKQLTEMFSSHEHCKRIRYQEVFFINATDTNDCGVALLKKYLVDAAFKQQSWGEKMPMAWVPLEMQINEMRSSENFIISYDELQDINVTCADLGLSDTQLKHFLRCQHSLGRLMYFDIHSLDRFVIVQPTAMVDILRSFITDEIFWPSNPSLRSILTTVSHTGVIRKSDLFKLWDQDEFRKYVSNES